MPASAKQLLVVVEAVGVGEHRHRAALALVLRVVCGPPAGTASRRSCRRPPCTGSRSIQPPEEQNAPVLSAVKDCATSGGVAAADGRDDLVVVDAADDLDRDPRVRLVERATACLITPSSRLREPVHSVIGHRACGSAPRSGGRRRLGVAGGRRARPLPPLRRRARRRGQQRREQGRPARAQGSPSDPVIVYLLRPRRSWLDNLTKTTVFALRSWRVKP